MERSQSHLLKAIESVFFCSLSPSREPPVRGAASLKKIMASPSLCRVTYVGLIQRVIGRREEMMTLDPQATLGELLRELCSRYGPEFERYLLEQGELANHATVLLNGRNAHSRGGLAARLGDDSQDHVEIVVLGPPVAGG
jgi:molybdopterin converting factor small subunit